MTKGLAFTLAAGLGLAAAQPAAAVEVIVGNDAVDRSEVDECQVCAFVLNQAFGIAGLPVYSFEFFAKTTGTVTPFLATRVDDPNNANFTITGIGLERPAMLGFNQFDFSTVFGSNITSANTYFGFAYSNGGVVAFNYLPSPTTAGTFVAPENFVPALNGTFSSSLTPVQNGFGALNTRTYSISATADDVLGAVPEPATWALMILGFGIVGSALRRRRTKVRFNFA